MAKNSLKTGFRVPFYEASILMIGGSLVCGGLYLGLTYSRPGKATAQTEAAIEVQAQGSDSKTADAAPAIVTNVTRKVDSLISANEKALEKLEAELNGKDVKTAAASGLKNSNDKKVYTFEVASYFSETVTEEHLRSLRNKGFKPFMIKKEQAGRPKHFINIGKFNHKEAALEYQSYLQEASGVKQSTLRTLE